MTTRLVDAVTTCNIVIKRTHKVAPCGICEKEVPRDDMWAVNIKFFNPQGQEVEKVKIRTCAGCADEERVSANECRWDNASMRVVAS